MSETFEKVLVKDDRLGCITSSVKYQVFKGGHNITCQPFKAVAETNASHIYNIPVPSLETIISREVLWRSTITLKISNPTKSPNEFCVNYGVTDALAPFPLHSLMTTMTATINNNTVIQKYARCPSTTSANGRSRRVCQMRFNDTHHPGLPRRLPRWRPSKRVPIGYWRRRGRG